MNYLFLITIILHCSFFSVFSKTAEEWKTRTIYQLFTDRFAKTDGDTTPCEDLLDYCGGTFKGIQNNLDYIQGMGFNAIWISPVQKNGPKGYHGYWYTNFYEINEHFGTDQDFRDLVKACHEKDIWVMVDIVANHISYVQDLSKIANVRDNDYSNIVPFNDPSYFNEPLYDCDDAEAKFPNNQTLLETCWLHWLPDLNQSHPFVRQTLLDWISSFVKTYEVDGLRLDALRHVPADFWVEFRKAAGVFIIGEAFDYNVAYLAPYQNVIDSPINFSLHLKLYYAFIKEGPMKTFSQYYAESYVSWPDISIVTIFLNVHDNPRFLSYNYDIPASKAALAFSLTSIGISSMYYGDEQGFAGGTDPLNREPLWTNMDPNSELYQFVKIINQFKHKTKLYELDQIERYVDDTMYVFSRGENLFAFSNVDENQDQVVSNLPYEDNIYLCNIFDEKDCVKAENGEVKISMVGKGVKIYFPILVSDSNVLAAKIMNSVKNVISSAISENMNIGSRPAE